MSEQRERVITPEGKLCFDMNLFERSEKLKYGAAMVIPAGVDIAEIKKLMMETAKLKYPKGLPHGFKWGVKSDDKANIEKYPYLKGMNLVQGSSGSKDFDIKIPVTDIAGNEVDRDTIKAGDTVRFSLSTYCYDVDGNKGVGFNINAVLLVERCAKEDSFYQKQSAADMFGEVFTSYENKALNDFEQSVNEAEESDLGEMNF